ncbi:SAS complex subunit [Sporothrix eucalyptigena]
MAHPKRKRPHDEDEASQAGKTRRATRQTSIPPPPLPVPPKEVPQRRALRGNADAEVKADDDTNTKTTRQGTVRTQRASGTSRTGLINGDKKDEDEEDHDDKGQESGTQEDGPEGDMSPRTKRRLARRSLDSKEDELGPTQKQQKPAQSERRAAPARNGRVVAAARPTTTTKGTRRAAKDAEIADSDADEAVDDKEEGEEDTEDELAGPATIIPPRTKAAAPLIQPPTTRRLRRPSAAQPAVTPVSPPKIPATRHVTQTVTEIVPPSPPAATAVSTAAKKETSIKPPTPPSPVVATTAGVVRPKKVTEIKPPVAPLAPRYPKATPIQPPPVPVSPTRIAPAPSHPPPTPEVQPQPQKPKAVQQLREGAAPSPRQQQQQAPKTQKQTVVTTASSNTSAANATATAPRSATTPTSATSLAAKSTAPPPSPSQPDRNIDKVVLGEICFKAWYPSYYGKEVLGDTAGNSHHGKGGHHSNQTKGAGKENHHHAPSHHYQQHAYGHGKDRDAQPMLDRLYVCPFCFKYSKEIVPWHGHVQVCESQFQIPGEKVYVHPKGVRTIRVPVSSGSASSTPKGGKRKRMSSEADVHYVEQVVKDEGEWSIWEVDGEKDVLFCQNLSLFAKLFLDNKSVFFDVTGFYYFLLVYTPPPSLPSSLRAAATATASPMGGANANGQASILGAAPRPRVVGFFSKEKMSWDNNNLACILVFPPWQRKGLGALLMGISYEISRREGILGGPEKPISDLGKKGYKRFWGAEIARWLLSVDIATATSSLSLTSSSSAAPSTSAPQPTAIPPPIIPPLYSSQASSNNTVSKGRKAGAEEESLIIDIADCSQATWIVRDDCLYVLREMGIAEEAGMGPPKKYCDNVLAQPDEHASFSTYDGTSGAVAGAASSSFAGSASGPSAATSSSSSAQTASASSSGTAGAQTANGTVSGSVSTGTGAAAGSSAAGIDPPREVQRVRISKAAVRQWVKDNHINLEKACDPAGFIKIYTNKDEAQQAAEEA